MRSDETGRDEKTNSEKMKERMRKKKVHRMGEKGVQFRRVT